MANTAVISKTSGVLFVAIDGLPARSFFGATGSYQFSEDTTTVSVTIGNFQSSLPVLQFSVPWTGLTIGGQVPANLGNARVLLNAIFGS